MHVKYILEYVCVNRPPKRKKKKKHIVVDFSKCNSIVFHDNKILSN